MRGRLSLRVLCGVIWRGYLSPLIQPFIPSSLTVMVTGSGSWDLYLPFSSRYIILGFRMKIPLVAGLRISLISSVLSGASLLPFMLR